MEPYGHGKKDIELKGRADTVDQLGWDPKHAELLATASGDKTVRLWDARRHTRYRTPGNGYRFTSTSMGIGIAASRISSEGSLRGNTSLYASAYRNFNRPIDFGRGQAYPKSLQQPQLQSLPRKLGNIVVGDIFMEAGRLAVEYLVSQGLLSPSVLAGKQQNGTLKKELKEFQELRPLEVEANNLQSPNFAPCVGNAGLDSVSGRRRLSDEVAPTGTELRNRVNGRRRAASFHGHVSDWDSRDYGRSVSFIDRVKASSDMDADDDADTVFGCNNQLQVAQTVGNGLHQSNPTEFAQKSETAGDLDSELIKYPLPNDVIQKETCSSGAEEDIPHDTSEQLIKMPDEFENLNSGAIEMKDDNSNDETKKCVADNLIVRHGAGESEPSAKHEIDLLAGCRFVNVPTKIRSSLTLKSSKKDTGANVAEEKLSDIYPQREEVGVDNDSLDGSSSVTVSNKTHNSKHPSAEVCKPLSIQDDDISEELYPTYGVEQGKYLRSRSFRDKVILLRNEQDSSHRSPVFGGNSSGFMERGQKRALQESDMGGETKKPRDMLPSVVAKDYESFPISNMAENQVSPEKGRPCSAEKVIVAVDHENSVNNFDFPKGGGEPCLEYAQEKQLFPNSFKICDLNLMEASDTHEDENQDNDPILIFPSTSETKREGATVHIDLSISNCSESGENGRQGANSKEIEIIDLENDSAQEDKAFHNSERKTETVYPGMEGFTNQAQSSGDIPDVQDGYGLMISELLGADFSNCSSVPADINSLHNEMDLPNGEGTLADDDSIYMSLGEIPLTYLRGWEQQPPQEYEKPF